MKKITTLIMLYIFGACIVFAANAHLKISKQTSDCNSKNVRTEGGIYNNSGKIIIESGAFIAIEGNYQSEGSAEINGEGTLKLAGNIVVNNTSEEPISSSGEIVLNGTNQQEISGNEINFGSLTISNSNGVLMNCNASVANSLTLSNGNLDLNSHTIVLGETALLSENGGRVFGNFGQIQTTRDLSNIDEDVAGLGAKIVEDGNLGYTTIIRRHAAEGELGIKRSYHITSANSPLNANLVFNYLDSELNGVTESDLKLFKSSDGENWTEQESAVLDVESNSLTLSGIDSFSYWTAGKSGSGSTLPVELSSFTAATTADNTVLLKWTVHSETLILGYNVLKNEKKNIELALKANPTLIIPQNNEIENDYSFEDINVKQNNVYYYWLEAKNEDLTSEYYGPIQVYVKNEIPQTIEYKTRLVGTYPNPFNPTTTIQFEIKKDDSFVEINIYNIKGELVKMLAKDSYPKGLHQARWNGKNDAGKTVSSGVYFARMKTFDYSGIKKLLLLK